MKVSTSRLMQQSLQHAAWRGAGGFPVEMKWHSDWFAFSVAALRSGIRYTSVPIGCWRESSGGYSQAARSGSKAERDVLQQIFSRLMTQEYADVREAILSPHMTPMLDDIGRQTLLSVLSKPLYWTFLRLGHFKNALNEIFAPWLVEEQWLGKLPLFVRSRLGSSLYSASPAISHAILPRSVGSESGGRFTLAEVSEFASREGSKLVMM